VIEGYVSDDGTPVIPLNLGQRRLFAILDTGFNGGLDLPIALKAELSGVFLGEFEAELAGGFIVKEDVYEIGIIFDGEERLVRTSFSDSTEALIGTRLLKHHRLEIDFPSKTVRITRPPKIQQP